MSVRNFVPEIWVARIYQKLQKTLVYADVANRDYEGEIRQAGDTVRITSIGPVSIQAYTGVDLTPEDLNDEQQTLLIDQQDAFAFQVDDVDAAQANVNLLQGGMDEAAYGMADATDQFIAGLYAQAATITGSTAVNSINVLAALLTLGQALDELNVPTEGRWCIIPPWLKTKLVLAKVLVENTTNEAFENGKVGRAAGFDLRVSNNVPLVGGTNYKIMAGVRKAVSYANQLTKVEAVRRELTFKDLIKGLHVYGGKVVYPDALAVLDATVAAEP